MAIGFFLEELIPFFAVTAATSTKTGVRSFLPALIPPRARSPRPWTTPAQHLYNEADEFWLHYMQQPRSNDPDS
jgi:hypothetical protein